MENQLLNIIRTLQEKEEELKKLQGQIAAQREKNKTYLSKEEQKLENELCPLIGEKEKISEELTALLNQSVVSITLGDLVGELSKLSGISVLNMGIKFEFAKTKPSHSICASLYPLEYNDICYSLGEAPHYIEGNEDYLLNPHNDRKNFGPNHLLISICGDNSLEWINPHQPFYYKILSPYAMYELQADGKMFFNHCSSVFEYFQYVDGIKKNYYHISVDRRIGDIVCHINIKQVIRGDEKNWKPSKLLVEAIMNCIEQGKYISPDTETPDKTPDEVEKLKQKLLK